MLIDRDKIVASRIELETSCVLDRCHNHLDHRTAMNGASVLMHNHVTNTLVQKYLRLSHICTIRLATATRCSIVTSFCVLLTRDEIYIDVTGKFTPADAVSAFTICFLMNQSDNHVSTTRFS